MPDPKTKELNEKQQRGGGDANERNEQQQQGGREQYQPGHGNRQSDQDGGKQ